MEPLGSLAVMEKKLFIEPYFMVINWSIICSLGVINLLFYYGGTLARKRQLGVFMRVLMLPAKKSELSVLPRYCGVKRQCFRHY
jgi:hypothetical protein